MLLLLFIESPPVLAMIPATDARKP